MADGTLFAFEVDPPIEGMVFAFGQAAGNVEDMTGLVEGFGTIFTGLMQRQFGSEGALAGGWAPLSAAYAAWKSARYPGRPIGVLSGALRSAMTGGAGYTAQVSSTSGSFGLGGGPATAYGMYFAGGGRGPARPVIKWGSGESRLFQKWAHAWLNDQLAVIGGHVGSNTANPSLLGGMT